LASRELTPAANGVRYFTRLPQANPNPALTVTHDHERAEIEAPSTLDHLGGTIDENDLLGEFLLATLATSLGIGSGTTSASAKAAATGA